MVDDRLVVARVLPIALLAMLGACSSDAGESCSRIPFATSCNGVTRTVMGRSYCLHVPPDYRENQRAPVVMMLHGYSADGQGEADYMGLDDIADELTFLLVLPNGTNDNVGLHYWNASPACCAELATNPPDDVAFLMAVLDDVESAYSVDTHREYVMGHSNGAFMTHRLACEHGDRFAAAASFGGAADPGCTPRTPISMLEIHGELDPLIFYGGGTIVGASVGYPSVEDTLAYWRDADGCEDSRSVIETRELVCDTTEHETHVERHAHCRAGTTVELWRMVGVGHLPSFIVPRFPTYVMDFLFAHRR